MKKSNGYYMRSYLKNNWLVLVCELVIVLLLRYRLRIWAVIL